ncbi:hypothetical protein PsorP6_009296 [Peronosclerospora sorghi]|uniref:Uncharacterized protein n=1 Tax=Peronosclerospora sorghi TaxID=230839 RepID=A0ACC0W172_9STRA|nr:hypothetical protein PsorP6_009296 [Peronosclerospora sorghi]
MKGMFARKVGDAASGKRTGAGLLSTDVLSASKRQRLEQWDAVYAPRGGQVQEADHETVSIVRESREWTIVQGASLPPPVLDALQKQWMIMAPHQRHHVQCCEAVIPSARHRGGCQGIPYFIFPLRTQVMLWQQACGKLIVLQLPEAVASQEVLQFFLFALDSQSLSFVVVGTSGLVLFWEDIELPYESVPVRVQIPLASNEHVRTHPNAAIVATQEEDLTAVMCWSNQGNVWEVAVENRRLRVRAFEKQNVGFFSGITKSVSQFFFASKASKSRVDGGEVDPNQPIQYVTVLPSTMGNEASISSREGDVEETADMLVLFQDGMLERRSFNIGDVMDCTCLSRWHFNATRVAINYFSDTFPEAHLAKVQIVLMPYVHETCFALLVAFICSSSRAGTNATTKYALFQLSLPSNRDDASPEVEWVHMLDYEPYFAEQASNRFFEVESFAVTRDAMYLVWPEMQPLQLCALLLPQDGQTSVRSAAFPLQDAEGRLAVAFGARSDPSALDSHAIKGSISFLLLENDAKAVRGSVCSAIASGMQKLKLSTAPFSSGTKRWRRNDVSASMKESARFRGKDLTLEDYMRLLLTHFHDDSHSTSALRFSARDVASVAQAAVGISFQLLDAKSSSGLRWEDEAHAGRLLSTHAQEKECDLASVTPKLVRYQLEEKRSRMMAFLEFLQRRCVSVWDFIQNSSDLQHYFLENEEKLEAAIALSKFQASILSSRSSKDASAAESPRMQPRVPGTFLLHAIEKTVERRGYQKEQLRLAGYNSFDVFYCEVSKIAELFPLLGDEMQDLSTSMGESDPTYLDALVEAGYAMLSMLCPPVQSSRASVAAPTGRWAFTREVRNVVAQHLSRLSACVGYPPAESLKHVRLQHTDVFELTDQIQRLGSVLLDTYARFIPLASSEDAEELRQEEAFTKCVTLNPLVYIATQTPPSRESDHLAMEFDVEGASTSKRADLFRHCVELCEKYCYFEGMVYLVYVEDAKALSKLDFVLGNLPPSPASLRLESYCKKHEGFDDFLFRWYNGEVRHPWHSPNETRSSSQAMMAYLLAHSQTFGPALHKFMKDREHLKQYRWLTAVAIERYDQAATVALDQAKGEQGSLSKRNTMASIAKIAALASPNLSDAKTVQDINHELVRGKLHKLLQHLPLKVPISSQPLAPEELVHACLTAAVSANHHDPMRTNILLMALEALETLATDPPTQEFQDMRASVWRSCIITDVELWDTLAGELTAGVNEERLESLMRETLLYKAMKEYALRPEYDAHTTTALTTEIIQEMVQREGIVDSAVSVQSQQLLIKTLHLALEQ